MDKSIRVRVLGREYALLVREEDEAFTRDIAAYVDAKMQSFKKAHPEQPELTAAVITALAIGEEFYSAWESQDREMEEMENQLDLLDQQLAGALASDGVWQHEDSGTEAAGSTDEDSATEPLLGQTPPTPGTGV